MCGCGACVVVHLVTMCSELLLELERGIEYTCISCFPDLQGWRPGMEVHRGGAGRRPEPAIGCVSNSSIFSADAAGPACTTTYVKASICRVESQTGN